MVVFEQSEEIPQPASSSTESQSTKQSKNIVEEIMMKYGLKKVNHPPIVIAKPITSTFGTTSAPPPRTEPTSATPPSEPTVKFSESRKKAVARKHANKSTTSTASVVSEQEVPSVQAEIVPET